MVRIPTNVSLPPPFPLVDSKRDYCENSHTLGGQARWSSSRTGVVSHSS